jgi:hypothetical protein
VTRTSTEVHIDAAVVGLRAVMPQRGYTLSDMTQTLTHLDRIWDAAHTLAIVHGVVEGAVIAHDGLWAERTPGGGLEMIMPGHESPVVGHLIMASPMDVSLLAEGVMGVAAAGSLAWYGIHLVKAVLEDPARVGAWLPKLVASWRREWADAAMASRERAIAGARASDLDAALARFLDAAELDKPERVELMNVDASPPSEFASLKVVASREDYVVSPRDVRHRVKRGLGQAE